MSSSPKKPVRSKPAAGGRARPAQGGPGTGSNALDIDNLRRRGGKKWSTYGDEVLPAWVADMDFPPAPAIERRLRKLLDSGDLGYPRDDHFHGLIDRFARRCRDRFHWPVDPDRVEVIADVMQGVRMCLQMFTDAGQGAAILTPIYPPFLYATRDMERRADCCTLTAAAGTYEIDWDRLDASIKPDTRVLLLCNPHNPTGRVFTPSELTGLAELALKHDLVVVSDEIHSDLVYGGHTHVPFASLGHEVAARTVTLMSASKSFNIAGLRCAMMVFGSGEHHARYRSGLRFVRGAISVPGMHATEVAWSECDDWLAQTLRRLEHNRDFIGEQLSSHLPDVLFHPPQATYLAWLDCRELGFGDTLWQTILDKGRLALSDGREFGAGGESCVRLNFATSGNVLEDALHRLRIALAS